MLEDHSSRWSSAASPGGLIGLILTILSFIAVVTSILSLTGRFAIALDDTILYVVLGLSTFTTFLLVYLVSSYVAISYRMDGGKLTICWGLWSVDIPYDQIEAAEPAIDVLGDQNTGWQPFWPGYYVGTRNTDVGTVRVVATLPPRRQILISRSNGEMYAISPERPMLFMEELARWHFQFNEPIASQDYQDVDRPVPIQEQTRPADSLDTGIGPVEPPHAVLQEPSTPYPAPETEEAFVPETPVERPDELPREADYRDDVTEDHRKQGVVPPPAQTGDRTGSIPNAPEQPAPVFGTSGPADQPPHSSPGFGTAAPEVSNPFRPNQNPPSEPGEVASEFDPVPYEVWFPERPPEREAEFQKSYQQFVDAGWTSEQQAVESPKESSSAPPFTAPKPVISPAGLPRSQVLQPLTRVYRSETDATSPAIRPTIHRDPVSLVFIGAGLVTVAAMALYILIQYQDIPQSLTLHWNVDGLPGRIGEPEEIWILPTIAGLVFVANIGLAWSIAQFDRFAARLMLSSTLIVHVVTWVALLMILQ